jgi:biopolymer transport protein ExbD
MRIRHRRQESHESAHGIDLAPMLDFVINLLIFFIITAVFVKESALQVSRPTAMDTSNDKETESIQIIIASTGEIYMDDREVDIRAVRANVERMSAVDPNAGVIIVANEMSPSGIMVEVVDQVHLGGIYNIMFTTAT